MKSTYIYAGLMLLLLSIAGTGCKKQIEVSAPPTSVTGASVYSADAPAIAVLNGIYANISGSSPANTGSIPSVSLYAGLSADELTLWSGIAPYFLNAAAYYQNDLSATPGYGSEFWSAIYPYIFSCNAAIDGINGSGGLSPTVKQQLLGEAKFMRAFFYFYLVNMYGGVPMALTGNFKSNSLLARSVASQVYQQIITDLHDAQKLLSANYLDATLLKNSPDRVRPTSWAATALLARVYLYTGNWVGADSASSILINNSTLFSLSSLDTVFLRASISNNEAIWQLQPVLLSPSNTQDGLAFIIPETGFVTAGNVGVYLSDNLTNAFEAGDLRKTHWIGSIDISDSTYYYPFKYKVNSTDAGIPVTEYYMLLRLGEQYLIRAEARANEGDIPGAQADLDLIRARAGLMGTTASAKSDLISAILQERRVELFSELGQRWFDLKRTGTVDATMAVITPQKTGGRPWNSYQQWYPVLVTDIQLDPNLQQNTGY